MISIEGEIKHPSDQGDGVRAQVFSSRHGLQGTWIACHGDATTSIQQVAVTAGDTIDFVVDCRDNLNSDSFTWAPTIRYAGSGEGKNDEKWNAKTDFSGPRKEFKPLTPWERYAQALLLSNELMFVD